MKIRRHIFLPIMLIALLWAAPALIAAAQEEPAAEDESAGEAPVPKVHVVQAGETLVGIATRYETTVEEIVILNGLANPDALFEGQELLIPGVAGELVATVYTVQAGDSLAGVAERFNTTADAVARSNRLMRPELRVGQRLAVVSRTGSAQPQPVTGTPHVVQPGDTLSGVALQYGVGIGELAAANELDAGAPIFAGQRLRIPSDQPYHFLPGSWTAVEVREAPIAPGRTVVIYADNLLEGIPGGSLGSETLHFTPQGDRYAAMVAFDPLTEPGLYELTLTGAGDRPWRPFRQWVEVLPAGYGTQSIELGPGFEELLDPAIRAEEDEFLYETMNRFSSEPAWEGLFQAPITPTNALVSSPYGVVRSYNGGPYNVFHSGVDYALPVGAPVLAPASGEVVFADFMQLRGNVVILDHGLGVMTAYFHLDSINVAAGQQVGQGQPIGTVGNTGLSSGPHLHWDLRINGIPVDGTQWLVESFP
jgi:murein DD-endopeptidase MepM/ murein hydrolase activator NlpD